MRPIAIAAFTPATIGILNRTNPFPGTQNISFAVADSGGLQSPQGKTGTVNVVHTPAAIPGTILLLRTNQVIDTLAELPDYRMQPRTCREPREPGP